MKTVNWCKENDLTLNVKKVREVIIDVRIKQVIKVSVIIKSQPITVMVSFKFFSTHISNNLKWNFNANPQTKKA